MNQHKKKPRKSKLSLICGIIGIFGCFAVIVTDIIGIIVVENHNPISETISSLAITESAWIQDLGLDFFAVAAIACAINLYTWNLGGAKWKIGNALLVLLGIDIILIAEHNQYAGREGVGASIHIQCVYALAVLFTITSLLIGLCLRKVSRNWYRYSVGTSIVWTILSPIFFVVPTNIDGAYERFISLIMIAWVAAISWLSIEKSEKKLSSYSA